MAPSDSHGHSILHSHVQSPEDVEDSDDAINFDSVHHTARIQEMPSILGHFTAFASKPLPHGVAHGALNKGGLLPKAGSLNVPLQMPLYLDTSARTIYRSWLGGWS